MPRMYDSQVASESSESHCSGELHLRRYPRGYNHEYRAVVVEGEAVEQGHDQGCLSQVSRDPACKTGLKFERRVLGLGPIYLHRFQ